VNEESIGKGDKTIPLTTNQYRELERAMQWPEDLASYDRLNTPTPISMEELFPENPIRQTK
jgi:hypothetical protein